MTETFSNLLQVINANMITLPAIEVMILLSVVTVCLLFRLNRVGMIVVYADAYRWGWVFFNKNFGDSYQGYMMGYYLFGAVVFILFVVGLLLEPKS